jgi:hypothetical protein
MHLVMYKRWDFQLYREEFELLILNTTAFLTSARRAFLTDRCQPQVVRNLFADHVL